MDFNDDVFCVLPFIGAHYDLNGKQYFCCPGSDDISEPGKALELKKKIADGERIDPCKECYRIEDRGGASARTRESRVWLQDPEINEYIKNWTPEGEQKVFAYEIRHSNKCNLQCISCKPEFSSLWAKELNVQIDYTPPEMDYDSILSSKKLYLAGGEPLVIEEVLDLLEAIADADVQPEVVINTNLVRVGAKLKDVLSRIKNLTLTISVDAYGKANEYHRYPLKWDKFIKNLDWAKTLDCTLMFNTVVDAITVQNLHKLVVLEDYISFWTLTFIVNRPWLEVRNVPEEYKNEVISNLHTLRKSKFYQSDIEFEIQVNAIINEVGKAGDYKALARNIKEIDARRNIDYRDYLDIDLEEYT